MTGISSGSTTIWAYNRVNGAYVSDCCDVKVNAAVNESGSAGANITYTVTGYENDLILSFYGYGNMRNYDGNSPVPWDKHKDQITRINVGAGITSIGDYAFGFMDKLVDVSLPNTITRIGDCAFTMNDSLATVGIPSSVTSIGNKAFWDSDGLTSITLTANLTHIEGDTFLMCANLTTATIFCDISSLPSGMFGYCKNLIRVRIPAVSRIEYGVFTNCPNLTTIYYGGTQKQWNNMVVESYNGHCQGKLSYLIHNIYLE